MRSNQKTRAQPLPEALSGTPRVSSVSQNVHKERQPEFAPEAGPLTEGENIGRTLLTDEEAWGQRLPCHEMFHPGCVLARQLPPCWTADGSQQRRARPPADTSAGTRRPLLTFYFGTLAQPSPATPTIRLRAYLRYPAVHIQLSEALDCKIDRVE